MRSTIFLVILPSQIHSLSEDERITNPTTSSQNKNDKLNKRKIYIE
jgi:hypothetical protein